MLSKDADFLYDTIETYIKDAEKANKSELVEILQTIKIDRKRPKQILFIEQEDNFRASTIL
jgi:hypothetical protein